jgi:hypothetical protein
MAKQIDNGLAKQPKYKRVEELAEALQDVRGKRMKLTEKEVEAANELIAEMHKHKLTVYKFDGSTVTILGVEKVKVKTADDEVQTAKVD